MTAETVHGVPLMATAQARVHLTTLALTEPGDVFYLAGDPERVYMRSPRVPRWEDDYFFIEMTDDCWRKIEHVGTGFTGQRVVVIHNTRKYCARPAEEC